MTLRRAAAIAVALAACQPPPPAPVDASPPVIASASASASPAASAAPPAAPQDKDRPPPAALGEADVARRCKPTTTDAETKALPPLSDKPIFAGTQHFSCNGTSASVLSIDFGDADAAKKGAALFTNKLWKGPRPTEETPDEILVRGSVMAWVSGSQVAIAFLTGVLQEKGFGLLHPETTDIGQAEVDTMLEQMKCSKPGRQLYCKALRAFAKGTPAGPKVGPLVGLAMMVDGRSFDDESLAFAQVDEGRGEVNRLGAFSPERKAQHAKLLATLKAGKKPPPTDPVATSVRSGHLEPTAHDTRRLGKSLILGGVVPVFLREADDAVIALTYDGPRLFEVFVFQK